MKKRILIFYDHFYPAWKAGGPVQSLVNLVRALYKDYDFYVVCKPHEMNETATLPGIVINEWNDWEGKAKVYYMDYGWEKRSQLQVLIKSVAPDVIYINGLFSLYFNIFPVQYSVDYCKRQQDCKLILSARGMLHPGALSQKALKKKLFLSLFQLMGWPKKLLWHATDVQEQDYIQQQFGSNMQVAVAGNFPNFLPVTAGPYKSEGELIMGTVALISPMKNHLAVLNALRHISSTVIWHIYGPVKDAVYWKECAQLIQQLPSHIKIHYHGELPPTDLLTAMQQMQLFMMPSKSENFGHALLEALSAGKPVITTDTTPFKDLQKVTAGFTVQVSKLEEQLPVAIEQFASMNNEQFASYCEGAALFARDFVEVDAIREQYQTLFTTA